jgi:hypothetical protein
MNSALSGAIPEECVGSSSRHTGVHVLLEVRNMSVRMLTTLTSVLWRKKPALLLLTYITLLGGWATLEVEQSTPPNWGIGDYGYSEWLDGGGGRDRDVRHEGEGHGEHGGHEGEDHGEHGDMKVKAMARVEGMKVEGMERVEAMAENKYRKNWGMPYIDTFLPA